MRGKYRIIKITRRIGDTYYIVQKRILFIFWVTFTESLPVGFADFMDLEVHYKSYEDAKDAILAKAHKKNKEIIYPDIENYE